MKFGSLAAVDGIFYKRFSKVPFKNINSICKLHKTILIKKWITKWVLEKYFIGLNWKNLDINGMHIVHVNRNGGGGIRGRQGDKYPLGE